MSEWRRAKWDDFRTFCFELSVFTVSAIDDYEESLDQAPSPCYIDFMEDLARNLKLTPQQRIEEHQKALNLVLKLQKAKKVISGNARPQSAS